MAQHKLTKHFVESLPLAEQTGKQSFYYDTEVKGFGIRVGKTSKTYIAETKIGRKTVRVTLGKHGVLAPEQARKLAREKLAIMAQGINPNEKNKQQKVKALTLLDVYQDYIKARQLKPNTLRDYDRCINIYLADWQHTHLTAITRDKVEAKHRKLSEKSPAKANLAMRFLRALFNFAVEYRDAKGQSVITDNPVKRLSAKKIWNRIKVRSSHLQPHQIKPWWEAVWQLENNHLTQDRETIRDYLLLLLFTGLRKEEALSLTWQHIDFTGKILTVTDTKNHEDHTLPLSDFLLELLQRRQKLANGSPWVFPGGGEAGRIVEPRKAMMQVTQLSGVTFTLHDLRRTFASIVNRLSDRMSYYTVKRLLNHKAQDVTAGYVQHDIEKLREAMQAVTDYIRQCAQQETTSGG